jgi:hypothetical protein
VFVPPDDDPETGSKHEVGDNETLLILSSFIDGIIRIILLPQTKGFEKRMMRRMFQLKTGTNTRIEKTA